MDDTVFPVGAIVPYAGPINDPQGGSGTFPNPAGKAYDLHLRRQGWLVCDGRALGLAQYHELFLAIGYVYGKPRSGHFNLPDYRGRFLRGVNYQAQGPDGLLRDPQATERIASAAGGWSGNQVGSVQDDALQAHEHTYQQAIAAGAGGTGTPVFSTYMTPEALTTGIAPPLGYTPSITVRTAPETTVKNVYANFLIRFTAHPASAWIK